MIISATWSRIEPKSVPEVDNKEKAKSYAVKIIKYLNDKLIVTSKIRTYMGTTREDTKSFNFLIKIIF